MKKRILAALLPLLCGLWACRKDDTPFQSTDYTVLPPATQTGANTFGCLVNGEVWVPRVPLFTLNQAVSAQIHENNNRGSGIVICNLEDNNLNDRFTIAFKPSYFLENVVYNTMSDTGAFTFNPDFNRNGENFNHIVGDTTNKLIIVKIDTINNFVSGKFKCALSNINNTQKIHIEEGRFDLRYVPQ